MDRPPRPWSAGRLAGVALAIVGCIGHRRGKPLAAVGAILSVLALVIWSGALAASLLR